MRLSSLARFAIAFVALAALSGPAPAQNYPTKPVTLMVPLAPGGGMDFIARTIGAKLSERLGQTVLVENRPGGGTIVATVALKNAPPDGYTILLVPGPTITTNLALYKQLPYDPRKDFAPVALTSEVGFALVVNPSLPVNNVMELVEYAKKRPGEVIMGSSGVGTMTHLAGELLMSRTGIKIRHAPYRGSPPALNDVIAGHIHMFFADPVTAAAQTKAGKVKALAVSSKTRLGVFPDVPPIAEAGIPGYEATNWHMAIAPAGTPPAVIEKLAAEFRAVSAMPDVKEKIATIGLTPLQSPPPAELRKFLASEIDTWVKFIQQIGIAGTL
ncbi:MAG: tripartite tricarboxylate transporter substrate binding protein [Alphaproteobacteria bacterium]|nr:tripartite tricarboxylate transporter substrate binding protein [Alphaproteobacteria bacterium]